MTQGQVDELRARCGIQNSRIAGTANANEFPISTTLCAAVLELELGAMRELHWHPHADEWQYYLEGAAEMAVYLGMGHTVTEQFVAGDIGYAPMGTGHYVRNTGSGILRMAWIQQRAMFFPRPQRMASIEPARCVG